MVRDTNINFSGPVLRTIVISDEAQLSEWRRTQQRQQRLQGHIFPIFSEDTQRTQKSECGATKATIGASGTHKGTQSNS